MSVDRRQIKRATELLVDDLGGCVKAGAVVGKGKTTVQRWYDARNADNADYSIPAADLREMEAVASDCFVTKALCRLNGGVFVRLPQTNCPEALMQQVLLLAKELGEVSGAIAEGLADGVFTAAEKSRALDQLHDLDTASATLRVMLTEPAGDGGRAPEAG